MKRVPFKKAVGLEHNLDRFSFRIVTVLLMGLYPLTPTPVFLKTPAVPCD